MGKKSANNGHHFDAERYAATAAAILEQAEKKGIPFEYETESGKLFLLQKIGMEQILEQGLFDKLDFFTKALASDDSKPAEEKDSFGISVLKNFGSMKETIYKVLLQGVIAPPLAPSVSDADKKSGVLYVDSLGLEDSMDLFGEILDMEGLSSFRKEPQASVGDVPAVETLPVPAE